MKPYFTAQPPVDAYGDNGFRLGGQRFQSSLIITPLGLYPWPARDIGAARCSDFQPLIEGADSFDIFILGCGASFQQLPKEVVGFLAEHRIAADLMLTAAACRTYNFLLSEGRRVSAALIPVA